MEQTIREFGRRIKRLRRSKGITAEALARQVGVTENAIRKLEAGDSKEPRFSTGLRIARILGAQPHTLLGRVENAPRAGPDLAFVIKEIRRRRVALENEGVEQIYVFGSVARGEARPESDIDIMVQPLDVTRFGLLNLVGVNDILIDALGRKVDVVTEQTVQRSRIRPSVEEDAVRVF